MSLPILGLTSKSGAGRPRHRRVESFVKQSTCQGTARYAVGCISALGKVDASPCSGCDATEWIWCGLRARIRYGGGPFRVQFGKAPYHQTPGFLIRRLHQIHVAIFLEECAAFNITPVQFSLLKTLSAGTEMD